MAARRQLIALGIGRNAVRSQVRAGRWVLRSPRVISTFTGVLTTEQQCWLGVLHAGQGAIVGGLTAATLHGLRHWHRNDISILVPKSAHHDAVPGVRWVRTRRNLAELRDARRLLPIAHLAPAVLMFGSAERSARTAMGVVAAVIQQRLVTPGEVLQWIDRLPALRRTALLRDCVAEFARGVESVGELDVAKLCADYRFAPPLRQVARRDSAGRWRYLDCEWKLPSGHTVCLEVDGAFHMEVAHWQSDIARARDLASTARTTIRCTAWELRTEPHEIAGALIRLGVPQTPVALRRSA